MADELLEVLCAVHVEAVPNASEEHCATKSGIADSFDVVEINISHGHDALVYSLFGSIASNSFGTEERLLRRLAVDGRVEDYIVALWLEVFQLVDGATRAGYMSFIIKRYFVFACQVYSPKRILVFQIVVVVNHNALICFLWKQREQALAVYGFRIGLSQV